MSSALASFAYLFSSLLFLLFKKKRNWNDFGIYSPLNFFDYLFPHFPPLLSVPFRCFFLSLYHWILFHFHVHLSFFFFYFFLLYSFFFLIFFYYSSDCLGRCGSHGPLFRPPLLHPPSLMLIPIFTSSNNSREINWEKRRERERK